MNLEHDDSAGNEREDDTEEVISLDELSQTYVNLINKASQNEDKLPLSDFPGDTPPKLNLVHGEAETASSSDGSEPVALDLLVADDASNVNVTPRSILEAVLFVGKPDNCGIPAAEIAGLMRGVQVQEIEALVEELNELYRDGDRAVRITDSPDGYRLGLAPQAEAVRDRFYGKVRTVNLSQAAVDCLALIAYQPGISRKQLDEQIGQRCGGVLNQLVRRQLVEIRREVVGGKSVTHYDPTEKLVRLAGLASLEDLPQVEEFE